MVYGNYHGIVGAGPYLIAENRVYGQSDVGIWSDGSSTVQKNVVYSNAIGIRTGGLGYGFSGAIKNNVIYANQLQGILAGGGVPAAQIRNNTIYQPLGDAVRVHEGTVGLDVRNNHPVGPNRLRLVR